MQFVLLFLKLSAVGASFKIHGSRRIFAALRRRSKLKARTLNETPAADNQRLL